MWQASPGLPIRGSKQKMQNVDSNIAMLKILAQRTTDLEQIKHEDLAQKTKYNQQMQDFNKQTASFINKDAIESKNQFRLKMDQQFKRLRTINKHKWAAANKKIIQIRYKLLRLQIQQKRSQPQELQVKKQLEQINRQIESLKIDFSGIIQIIHEKRMLIDQFKKQSEQKIKMMKLNIYQKQNIETQNKIVSNNDIQIDFDRMDKQFDSIFDETNKNTNLKNQLDMSTIAPLNVAQEQVKQTKQALRPNDQDGTVLQQQHEKNIQSMGESEGNKNSQQAKQQFKQTLDTQIKHQTQRNDNDKGYQFERDQNSEITAEQLYKYFMNQVERHQLSISAMKKMIQSLESGAHINQADMGYIFEKVNTLYKMTVQNQSKSQNDFSQVWKSIGQSSTKTEKQIGQLSSRIEVRDSFDNGRNRNFKEALKQITSKQEDAQKYAQQQFRKIWDYIKEKQKKPKIYKHEQQYVVGQPVYQNQHYQGQNYERLKRKFYPQEQDQDYQGQQMNLLELPKTSKKVKIEQNTYQNYFTPWR